MVSDSTTLLRRRQEEIEECTLGRDQSTNPKLNSGTIVPLQICSNYKHYSLGNFRLLWKLKSNQYFVSNDGRTQQCGRARTTSLCQGSRNLHLLQRQRNICENVRA